MCRYLHILPFKRGIGYIFGMRLIGLRLSRLTTMLFGLAWLPATILGMSGLASYSLQEGAKGLASPRWPSTSHLVRHSAKPTLLVFLHPECFCSRATLGELDKLLARVSEPPETVAVFIRPKNWSDAELKSGLWRYANRIPHVKTVVDSGTEAELFGAKTSGHATLYASTGELLFSGGITAARGHAGDNAGTASIARLLREGASATRETDVFGCGLFDGLGLSRITRMIAQLFPGVAL